MQVLPCSVPLSQYFFPRKFRCHGTWFSSSIWPSDVPRSRSKMASTDLSSSSKPHVHRRGAPPPPPPRGFTNGLCSLLFFCPSQTPPPAAHGYDRGARPARVPTPPGRQPTHPS